MAGVSATLMLEACVPMMENSVASVRAVVVQWAGVRAWRRVGVGASASVCVHGRVWVAGRVRARGGACRCAS